MTAGNGSGARVNPHAAVCVLHGDPPLPRWLYDMAETGDLYLVINDPSPGAYLSLPDKAQVLRNERVLGFATNVNHALQVAFAESGPELVFILNFDVEMELSALHVLRSALAENPRLGLAGAYLIDSDARPVLSVGTLPSPLRESARALGLRSGALARTQRSMARRAPGWTERNRPMALRVTEEGEYVPWTCVALRRSTWFEVGPLDERFPLYGEDIDWGLRCRLKGWEAAVVHCGPVVHHGRATRSPRSDALYEYSHLELHRKWNWGRNLEWQRKALRIRRTLLLRSLLPPLDWPLLTNLDSVEQAPMRAEERGERDDPYQSPR